MELACFMLAIGINLFKMLTVLDEYSLPKEKIEISKNINIEIKHTLMTSRKPTIPL